jgi:hypothetical protein
MKRFTIATLMILVLVSGVAVAALRDASDLWVGILLSITLLLLGISLAGILQRREGKRAFWQGFAIFGWGYLILTQAPWFSEFIAPRLPTTQLLSYIHAKANPDQGKPGSYSAAAAQFFQVVGTTPGTQVNAAQVTFTGGGTTTVNSPQTFRFVRLGQTNLAQFTHVGNQLFTLLAALVGAGIFRWFHRTNRPAETAPTMG